MGKDLIVTERPAEASLVMRQIKESKQERKKQPGYNKKHVRNINDIIEKDQKTVKEIKKKQSTKEHVEKKRKHMLKKQVGEGSAATQDDGFVDGSDLESESGSLVEMMDDIKLVDDIKLDVSLDSSMESTDEESDY